MAHAPSRGTESPVTQCPSLPTTPTSILAGVAGKDSQCEFLSNYQNLVREILRLDVRVDNVLPIVIACGETDKGKSMVLNRISGLPILPTRTLSSMGLSSASGTHALTIAPLVVNLQPSESVSSEFDAFVEIQSPVTPATSGGVRFFPRAGIEEDNLGLMNFLRATQGDLPKDGQSSFSRQKIDVVVQARVKKPFQFIDLPGIHLADHGNAANVSVTRDITKTFLEQSSNCLVLLIVSPENVFGNFQIEQIFSILTSSRAEDRTILVFTRVDRLNNVEKQKLVDFVLKAQVPQSTVDKRKLPRDMFLVRNPDLGNSKSTSETVSMWGTSVADEKSFFLRDPIFQPILQYCGLERLCDLLEKRTVQLYTSSFLSIVQELHVRRQTVHASLQDLTQTRDFFHADGTCTLHEMERFLGLIFEDFRKQLFGAGAENPSERSHELRAALTSFQEQLLKDEELNVASRLSDQEVLREVSLYHGGSVVDPWAIDASLVLRVISRTIRPRAKVLVEGLLDTIIDHLNSNIFVKVVEKFAGRFRISKTFFARLSDLFAQALDSERMKLLLQSEQLVHILLSPVVLEDPVFRNICGFEFTLDELQNQLAKTARLASDRGFTNGDSAMPPMAASPQVAATAKSAKPSADAIRGRDATIVYECRRRMYGFVIHFKRQFCSVAGSLVYESLVLRWKQQTFQSSLQGPKFLEWLSGSNDLHSSFLLDSSVLASVESWTTELSNIEEIIRKAHRMFRDHRLEFPEDHRNSLHALFRQGQEADA